MTPTWAQRREDMLSDCIVFPDVFTQMVERLGAFVVPYQQALETEADQHPMHLYLQGLLSHLPGKNAEDIATFVNVERQVIQDFIGTVPWDHRPLVAVLVGQVAERLGEPDGIIAFDPSSFPSIHVRRDSRSSIAYSEELISATMSATLQSTDRHDGIVGQECCHFQRDL